MENCRHSVTLVETTHNLLVFVGHSLATMDAQPDLTQIYSTVTSSSFYMQVVTYTVALPHAGKAIRQAKHYTCQALTLHLEVFGTQNTWSSCSLTIQVARQQCTVV